MAFDTNGDVFVNFSAEDIGKNFGAHLHRSLLRADIQTIIGDSSRSDTLSSVQQSRLSVVVFSKNYVSSGKALDELVNIRECSGTGGLVVLPIFYNVDRYTSMNQLETSEGGHELQQTRSMSRWRQALEEISSMPGYDLYKFADQNEAACIHKFVETILSELHIINSVMDRTFISPSLSSTLDWNDIFISFCGSDTRRGFASHLYQAFSRAGICTFIDDNLLRGKVVTGKIERAIQKTKIAVVVFSKHYADSIWCLDELIWIIKRRRTGLLLVPAFFDVDPSVVRQQTQNYGEALKRHDKRMCPEVQTWRAALTEAANTSGFSIQCDNGNEAKFIEVITEAVAEKVRSLRPELAEAIVESALGFQQTIEIGNEVEIAQTNVQKVCEVNSMYNTELQSFPSYSRLTPQWNVFLSFRGVDTRKTFISHMNMEMKHARIKVFLDDDALRRGYKIRSGLLSAIQESKILIIVFSKNYASSKWCLDELVQILERQKTQNIHNQKTTGQLVFPIYYDVDQQDVEKLEGSFGRSFEINNKRYPKETVDNWRAALSEAGTMEGWDLRNSWDGREADLIQDVIAKALHEITTK